MTHDFNFLFLLLDKENIHLDKNEFIFQIQSHPDYPSLLSVSDTLTYFKIPNIATKVSFENFNELPDRFIVLLSDINEKPTLFFIEKNDGKYFKFSKFQKEEITEIDLKRKWNEIVLLIDQPEFNSTVDVKTNKVQPVLSFLFLIIFFITIIQAEGKIEDKLFFIFPGFGLLLSFAALKDLFGTKSDIINKFCSFGESTSCSSVIESSKWDILKIINFSDLSVIFFSSQFFGLLTFVLLEKAEIFFLIEKVMLLSALPVILMSIYYQKYIEKKWCPICLAIVLTILLEFLYVQFFLNPAVTLSFQFFLTFMLVFVSVSLMWVLLKSNLTEKKYLKDFKVESLRFKRNFKLFKSALQDQDVIVDNSTEDALVLGNKNAPLKISFVTNPYCGYCKGAHTIIDNILKNFGDEVTIYFRFNYNEIYEGLDQERKQLHLNLVRIYQEQGEESFLNALERWFKEKDIKTWIKEFSAPVEEEKLLAILKSQFDWLQRNNLNFTPALIVGMYQYPIFYEREELQFFIPDLIEETI